VATELATAYVSLVPSFQGGAAALSKQMGGPAAIAGTQAGKRFGGGFAGSVKKFGLIAGAGLAAVGVGLFGVGKTFDKVSDTIRVGTGATGKALDGLIGSAKNVGRDVPANFADIGDAVADLNTRLGVTGKPLEALATQFLNVSRITGTDLKQNIAGVTRVFGDWGIESKNQAGALDAIFRASQSTGAGFDALQAQVVKFGAPMRQLGFSFEDTLALLGKFEKEGVNTELVMGSMRIALGRMAREGEAPVKTLRRVTDEIKNAGSSGKANALALELFGARAGPDMAAAIREGRFEVGDLADTIANGTDTINSAAKDTESFGEKWQIFKNRVLVAIEPIASRFFDAVGRGMDWIMSTGVPALRQFAAVASDRLRPAMETVGSFLRDAVLPALRHLGRFLIQSVIPAVADFGRWLQRYQAWLVPLAVGILTAVAAWKAYQLGVKVAAAVTKAWIAVQAIFNAVMAANPIVLVMIAIIALTAAIVVAYKRSETFRRIVQTVWKAIQTAIQFAWRSIIKPVMDALVAAFKRVWETGGKLRSNVVTAFNKIREGIGAAWAWIRDRVFQPWVDRFNWVREKLVRIKDGILNAFRSMRDTLGKVFAAAIEKIKSPIRGAFKWINRNLIANLNKVTKHFNLTINPLPVNFNRGGVVPGGGPDRDSVHALLTPGEGVLTRSATKALGGRKAIDAINSGLAFGGPIDWIKEGLAKVGSQIGDWLRRGAAFALDKILGAVIGVAGSLPVGFQRTFSRGILRQLRPLIKKWGEGKDALAADTAPGSMSAAQIAASGWARPIGAGYRLGRGSRAHGYPAQDLPAPIGTPIFAPTAGRVIQSLDSAISYGKRVMMSSPVGRVVLAHMSRRVAQVGDFLRAGQLAGYVGSTGNSTGPHLHLEIGRNDPLSFLRRMGVVMDAGGTLAPGPNLVLNNTGGPETLRRVGVNHADLGRPIVIEIRGDGTRRADFMVDELRRAVRVRGGDVQTVLGPGGRR
jgi:TP901 family phage tail tape measure protein